VAGSSIHGNISLCPMKGEEFINQLSDYWNSAPFS
jgi:hypothetical protein